MKIDKTSYEILMDAFYNNEYDQEYAEWELNLRENGELAEDKTAEDFLNDWLNIQLEEEKPYGAIDWNDLIREMFILERRLEFQEEDILIDEMIERIKQIKWLIKKYLEYKENE